MSSRPAAAAAAADGPAASEQKTERERIQYIGT